MTAAKRSSETSGRRGAAERDGARSRRSVARLAAIQALYQIELTGAPADAVIEEFKRHRLGRGARGPVVEGDALAPADRGLFAAIVSGVIAKADELDTRIGSVLVEGWTVTRIESILRAILRGGCYELAAQAYVPARVVVSEYVDIAHAFFAGKEAGMANGVLNRLARVLRPDEFQAGGDGPLKASGR
ncbi:MAG: transcription antitermination factor NusB [Alphaproteobacteria bacterium]|nr:transcription antitermination factor NusB [Alphaproteobacteria bacterium]